MAENSSFAGSFDTSAFVISNNVRQPVPLPDCLLPGEEGLDCDGELGGNSLQKGYLARTRIVWRHRTEPERTQTTLAGSEGNENESANPELSASTAYKVRPASFRIETRDYEWLLVQPYPTGGILVDRQRKVCDLGIAWRIQNVPPHHVAVGIVQDQAHMIKTDNSAKRFGYALEQTSEISAAGD